MTKVVFHLGDKKTGSTAIQTALASKSWTCAAVSLLYPGKERLSHIAVAKSLQKRTGSPGMAAPRFRELVQEIRAVSPDIAVISAEDFEDVDPAALKAAVRRHMPDYAERAQYIAYVRPHVDRLASSFAERVKASGFDGTMDALYGKFNEKGTLTYTPRFQAWRDTFGDAFELRPMIRDRLYKADVVQDFLQFALGTDDFSVEKAPNANESVTLENLAVLLEMQVALKPEDGSRSDLAPAFCRYVARQMNLATGIKGTKVQYHRSLADRMVAECAADAQALDAAFFTGTPMMDALAAAPAKAVDQPQSLRIEDHFSPREQFLIRLWAEQTRTFVKADPLVWASMLRADQRDWVMGTYGLAEADDRGTTAPEPVTDAPARPAGRRPGRMGAGKAAGMGPAGGAARKGPGQGPGQGRMAARKRPAEAVAEAVEALQPKARKDAGQVKLGRVKLGWVKLGRARVGRAKAGWARVGWARVVGARVRVAAKVPRPKSSAQGPRHHFGVAAVQLAPHRIANRQRQQPQIDSPVRPIMPRLDQPLRQDQH